MPYHVNPETGRPNICRATIRDCQFGSSDEHFESKQEAATFVEKGLSAELGSFSTLTRASLKVKEFSENSTFENLPKRSEVSLEKQLGVIPREKLNALIKKRLRNGYTNKEIEKLLKDRGSYDSVPFYVYFNGNQEMTLKYDDHETHKTFTKGACAVLASELNRVTGLPLVVFTHDKENSSSWEGHVALKLPNGDYFDIEGDRSKNSFRSSFPGFSSWSEDEVSRDEFNEVMGLKKDVGAVDHLDPLEKAALAKICLDLINDYNLTDPEKAGVFSKHFSNV